MAKKKKTESIDSWADIIRFAEEKSKTETIYLKERRFIEGSLSTGSLALDLSLGGGWAPGRMGTLVGPESSAKSTVTYHTIKNALELEIPCVIFDYEGSIDRLYLEQLGVNYGLHSRDEPGSSGLLQIYWPDYGETAFRLMKAVLRNLPDSDAGPPQVLFVLDSLFGMEAEADDDEKGGLASKARMFSKHFPKIRTLLARKRGLIVATNQLRQKVGVTFGSPEYEPCGEAVKFFTDQRVKITRFSKSLSDSKKVKGLGQGGIEQETHVTGYGYDRYMYSKTVTTKNKAFSPMKTAELRIWYEEQGGVGRGIDPVYDVCEYLRATGQISISQRSYEITLPGFEGKYTWPQFKSLVLRPGYVDTFDNVEVYDKTGAIVEVCREQIRSSEAFRFQYDHESAGGLGDYFTWGEIVGYTKARDKSVKLKIQVDDGELIKVPVNISAKEAKKLKGLMAKVYSNLDLELA